MQDSNIVIPQVPGVVVGVPDEMLNQAVSAPTPVVNADVPIPVPYQEPLLVNENSDDSVSMPTEQSCETENAPVNVVNETAEPVEPKQKRTPRMSIIGLRSRLKETMELACNTLETVDELAKSDDFKGRHGAKATREMTGTIVATGIMIPIAKTVAEYMLLSPNEMGYMVKLLGDMMTRGE